MANKKFSLINIIGFAFAISVCLAISLFVIHEYSYDRYHKNADHIVRLIDSKRKSSDIDYRVKDKILANFPEVENLSIVNADTHSTNIGVNNQAYLIETILSTDENFFEIFDIPFIDRASNKAFPDLNSVILSQKTAKLLFGDENPMGKEVLYEKKTVLLVSGIIEDMPESSSIKADIIVNAENDQFKFNWSCEDYKDKSSYRWSFMIYAQLHKNTKQDEIKKKFNQNIKVLEPYISEVDFLPLTRMYLHDKTTESSSKRGNLQLIKLLSLIGIIILVLAMVNYINLSLARQQKSEKLIAIRKSFGASKSKIILHSLCESIMISVFAFLLGSVIFRMCLRIYESIFNTSLSSTFNNQFTLYIGFALAIVAVGVLSGIIPAVLLSKKSPIATIHKSIGSKKGGISSRNALIIFQFTTSIALIICVFIIKKQIFHVKHHDLGFQQEQLLRLNIPILEKEDHQNCLSLVSELQRQSFVKNICMSNGSPGKVKLDMGAGEDYWDEDIWIPTINVDSNFLKTFNIELIKGRTALASEHGKVCYINEEFFKHMKMTDLKDKYFGNYGDYKGYKIIGVVKNYNYSSLHNLIAPMCMIQQDSRYDAITIRLRHNNISHALDVIESTWTKLLPAYPFTFNFYDDWYNTMYKKEERLAETITLFALLAIAISCFGILGLAIFSAEQRTKEIGVRKTNGAKNHEIIKMLNKDFLKWVGLAFVLACPIAWYTMNKWLQSFAYKTELSWWIFALAGIIAMSIALLTVSWQSWRAAKRNPVESLRYE